MKKILLSALMMTILCTGALAQNVDVEPKAGRGWYIRGGASYFFSITPGEFPNVSEFQPYATQGNLLNPATGARDTTYMKNLTGSYGEGVRGGIAGGYMFNKTLGVEVDVNYFKSVKNLMSSDEVFAGGNVIASRKSRGYVQAVTLAPSLVFALPIEGKFKPYTRIGFTVPLWGTLTIESSGKRPGIITDPNSPLLGQQIITEVSRVEKVDPKPTIGFQGALGVSYKFMENLGFYAETEYRNIPVGSKNKETTEYTRVTRLAANGTVIQSRGINDLKTYERQTNYQKELTTTSNNRITNKASFDENKPLDDNRNYINIGGLGFSVGLKYSF
ncbi:outer membrane beta-barrel protein [Solitalea lacus]|uniref:outer membrane beta-barrel protein n=1 Tax=Solitalea lacus TaxID=2911172 RepID=UPI001EDAF834|nr:outer membrane beta-barrel protein [Solitalea lacus]UKJ05772.1 outer membrane beta-barrel protein [Solitalea lacus]